MEKLKTSTRTNPSAVFHPSLEASCIPWSRTVWVLDPKTGVALWLKSEFLSIQEGFRKMGRVWAIVFEPKNDPQSFEFKCDLTHLRETGSESFPSSHAFTLGNCVGTANKLNGKLQKGTQSLTWDFELQTLSPDLTWDGAKVTGEIILGHKIISFEQAHCVEFNEIPSAKFWTHLDSSVLASCPLLYDAQTAAPIEAKLSIYQVQNRVLGASLPGAWKGISLPRKIVFSVQYKGQLYHLHPRWISTRTNSQNKPLGWEFEIECNDLKFKGQFDFDHKDAIHLSFDDPSGSILYAEVCAHAHVSMWVYQNGKLESSWVSKNGGLINRMSHQKLPYTQWNA